MNAALNEFRNVHQSVKVLLDEEERKRDNDDWYLPKIQNFETFLKEVATWKIVQKNLQAVISPSDSISNVSHSKMKSSRSIASSSARTVSSARLRAEAEKAALLQRAEGLKKKHALELERIEVQNKFYTEEQRERFCYNSGSSAKGQCRMFYCREHDAIVQIF